MPTVPEAAARLAQLLSGSTGELSDTNGSDLEFFATTELRPLERLKAPQDCWAVDGGQALVADARCLQVAATRGGALDGRAEAALSKRLVTWQSTS